jgi:hypothetical protein
LFLFAASLAGSLLLDRAVQPRRAELWRWQGLCLHFLIAATAFGLTLAGSGNFIVSALLTMALATLFTLASNAKHAMLGEPLLFSDLALIVGIFRHPRFYLTAIPSRQRWLLAIMGPIIVLILARSFVGQLYPHVVGFGMLAVSIAALFLLVRSKPFSTLAPTPDVDTDTKAFGLFATLLLYWLRWRETPDPPACPPLETGVTGRTPSQAEIIVVVQCESFADPVELIGEGDHMLSGLALARASATQWGNLEVSGFGAYTMRTEYGVLFGRNEADLGFRRYDPFLSARGETSYALSTQLTRVGYQCLFVHPHDMRFYGRDRLMPSIGFKLVGEESFAPISTTGHRYVNDRVLGASIGEIVGKAEGPTFVYAVTMENHGPWDAEQLTGSPGALSAYLGHLRGSDGMLTDLVECLSASGRPALLVFFGDHRPSIPGVTEPGGARHTPYVLLHFSADGEIVGGEKQRVDLTPDELHHVILRCVQSGSVPTAGRPNERSSIGSLGMTA